MYFLYISWSSEIIYIVYITGDTENIQSYSERCISDFGMYTRHRKVEFVQINTRLPLLDREGRDRKSPCPRQRSTHRAASSDAALSSFRALHLQHLSEQSILVCFRDGSCNKHRVTELLWNLLRIRAQFLQQAITETTTKSFKKYYRM